MQSAMYLPIVLISTLCALCHGGITREMSLATNEFTVEVLKTAFNSDTRESNTIMSPLSVHTLLGMLQQGAGDPTQAELSQVLHAQPAALKQGYKELITNIKTPREGLQLEFSNKVFVASGIDILPEFKNMTVEDFKSDIESVDFSQAAAAARAINSWVNQSTHQRIQELVDEDSLTPDTVMVLLNAVFFSGEWDEKFSKEATIMKEFHTLNGSSKQVSTMHHYNEILFAGHCHHIGAKYVHLPFTNPQYSMLVVVPDERDGLGNVLNNMRGERLHNLTRRNEERYVKLALPKFKFETTSKLNNLLATMGLQNIFQNSANLTGITGQNLKVSDVRQKANIEVDENGAKAAAATSIRLVPMSAIQLDNNELLEIDADRPFLTFIVDAANSVPIFSAWIGDP